MFSSGSKGYTREATPRIDQKRWVSEAQVVDVVVRCVRMADFCTGHDTAIREYAAFIRMTYGSCSQCGLDVDAGVRAINYIKKIHSEAKGSRRLWNEVMKMAQYEPENEEHRLPGLPPPVK